MMVQLHWYQNCALSKSYFLFWDNNFMCANFILTVLYDVPCMRSRYLLSVFRNIQ